MQQWEYLWSYYEVGKGEYRIKYMNGRELANWKDRQIHDVLNDLGQQGWELVGITGAGSHQLVFKRPK